jgi:hypothetical protein
MLRFYRNAGSKLAIFGHANGVAMNRPRGVRQSPSTSNSLLVPAGAFVGAVSLPRLADESLRSASLACMLAGSDKVAQSAFRILLVKWRSLADTPGRHGVRPSLLLDMLLAGC